MKFTVYLRTNTVNNKQYVGQTGNFKEREGNWRCLKTRYANDYLSDDREKYGLDNFTVEVLAETDNREDAWELEQKYITEYDTIYPNGYNLVKGGGGTNGLKHSEDAKQKISGNHAKFWLGKHRSEETKNKISEAHKGTQFTDEHKQKISETLKGKKQTKEHIEKLAEANKKPVIQSTKDDKFIKQWDSATDAKEELGIGHISECCHGKIKSAGGFKWSFIKL